MKLSGKTAIITGGGRGFGRASAAAMAREGAAVILISRTAAEVEEAAAAIEAGGGRAVPLAGDVTDAQLIIRAADVAQRTFGSIDIVMNNAAVVRPFKPLWRVEPGEWQEAMMINLQGPQMLCRAVVPLMIEQGSGKIINVTSGLGTAILPPFGVYSVTKAGLDHFTRILAEELRGHNIQVNGLDPGVMDTPMQAEIRQAGRQQLGETVYMRFAELKERKLLALPEQVARLAVFLASPESDGVTGEIGTGRDYARFGFRV